MLLEEKISNWIPKVHERTPSKEKVTSPEKATATLVGCMVLKDLKDADFPVRFFISPSGQILYHHSLGMLSVVEGMNLEVKTLSGLGSVWGLEFLQVDGEQYLLIGEDKKLFLLL